MKIMLNKKTIIYILCPASLATGGPELLHQLGHNLINIFNLPTFIVYFNIIKDQNPICLSYKKYDIPVMSLDAIQDSKNNIVITPEIYEACSFIIKWNSIKKIIWFLSVDNFYLSRILTVKSFKIKFLFLFNALLNKFHLTPVEYDLNVLDKLIPIKNDLAIKSATFYMTNSYRGVKWYSERGLLNIQQLSEYINPDFFKSHNYTSKKKQNIVLYNPKKGMKFTQEIIKKSVNIKFIPIQNMSREKVSNLLSKAKVYIDFGNHPGKDRLPREAAISGCCIITGKRGSAGYYEDVSIENKYKFDDNIEMIPNILSQIQSCLNNYDENITHFEFYRRKIQNEHQLFIDEINNIFLFQNS